MANLRYVDAATVSDEHGKGVEILRQEIAQLSSASAAKVVLYAEVDLIIRSMYIANTTALTAGSVVLQRKRGSTTTSLVTYTLPSSGSSELRSANSVVEVNVSPSHGSVKRGDILIVNPSAIAPAPSTSNIITVHVGWMPDMFSIVNNPRSYSLPN